MKSVQLRRRLRLLKIPEVFQEIFQRLLFSNPRERKTHEVRDRAGFRTFWD